MTCAKEQGADPGVNPGESAIPAEMEEISRLSENIVPK
jgi:hypothetical protein